ncbi:MAG: adenosine-specific kinase [Thermoproteota archaeon]|jgi:adenosine/AMP kinase|nr:adenosine-specific kinase [Thermoproteota archaeon]
MGQIVTVDIKPIEGINIILGQSHFIKTVEDIYEAIVNISPFIKFGIAFCESSGPRLIRKDGNDEELINLAVEYAKKIGAGHIFVVCIKQGYPINILNAIKMVPEVVNIYCATANPVKVILYEEGEQRGVLGVCDGFTPLGIEDEDKTKERIQFLRKIGYKRG